MSKSVECFMDNLFDITNLYNILQSAENQESHSGIMYGMTATNQEMAMCTDVIRCQNPDTDRPVGWHSTVVPASYTHH